MMFRGLLLVSVIFALGVVFISYSFSVSDWAKFWLVIGWSAFCIFFFLNDQRLRKEKIAWDKACQDYQAALKALSRASPTPALKQRALETGREKLRRERLRQNPKSVARLTARDEAIIRNDIDAACSSGFDRASTPLSEELAKLYQLKHEGILENEEWLQVKSTMTGGPDTVDKTIRLLRGLKDLYSEGALTESEFNMKKWEVLSRRIVK